MDRNRNSVFTRPPSRPTGDHRKPTHSVVRPDLLLSRFRKQKPVDISIHTGDTVITESRSSSVTLEDS